MDEKQRQVIFRTQVIIQEEGYLPFIEWQARFHSEIVQIKGFISLEISSIPVKGNEQKTPHKWEFTQRFDTMEDLNSWKESKQRLLLLEELTHYLKEDPQSFVENISELIHPEEGIIEVIITDVKKEFEVPFREWVAKIHKIESKFPGFQKVYIQSPSTSQGESWITFLQFDAPENLDKWLVSSEREDLLKEGGMFVNKMESHRVVSSFAGWFANRSGLVEIPPVWKQTMIVLLGLFPIVMLELKYLSPLLQGWHPSPATFISNAISVFLISWPVTPFLIKMLRWWLNPKELNSFKMTLWGTSLVMFLYLLEVIFFFNFF